MKKRKSKSFKIERLLELRSILSSEKDLSKIWDFYMDNFSDHKDFADVGHPLEKSELESIVPRITKQMFKEDARNLFLIVIPEYKFIHGGFFSIMVLVL